MEIAFGSFSPKVPRFLKNLPSFWRGESVDRTLFCLFINNSTLKITFTSTLHHQLQVYHHERDSKKINKKQCQRYTETLKGDKVVGLLMLLRIKSSLSTMTTVGCLLKFVSDFLCSTCGKQFIIEFYEPFRNRSLFGIVSKLV